MHPNPEAQRKIRSALADIIVRFGGEIEYSHISLEPHIMDYKPKKNELNEFIMFDMLDQLKEWLK
ncbi:hypothetical protein C4577_04980 [Candidatus Parcubacteria bacterium]|nr:MAG: hypothetical protein C4577_04980 [Candidatus Parcubacteria bacterium]